MASDEYETAPRGWSAWVLLPLLLTWPVLWALLGSGFTGDDWNFLALARHGGGPLGFYLHDHFFTYMYRPVAMGLWWISAALLGDTAWGHYAVNLMLHGVNASLVAVLVRAAGVATRLAVLAGVAFALHPVGAGTTVWLSDRFDLLATLGTLCALRVLVTYDATRGTRRAWALAALALASAVAAGSKETAIVLVPAAGLWLLMQPLAWRPRLAAGVALTLPFAAFLLARRAVLGSWGGPVLDTEPLQAFAGGSWAWLLQWPLVLSGTAARWSSGMSWPLLLCAAMGAVLLCGLWRAHPRCRIQILMCLTLAGATAVVQAPVTHMALVGEAPFVVVTNLRFYYLAMAAVFVALALAANTLLIGGQAPGRHWNLLGALLPLVLLVPWIGHSWAIAHSWKADTANAARLATVHGAAAVLRSLTRAPTPDCVILLLGAAPHNPDFAGFSDTLSKAQLAPGNPAFDCVVMAEAPPWVALTRVESIGAHPALRHRPIGEGRSGPQRVGPLAFHFPAALEPADERMLAPRTFRWDGERFVEQFHGQPGEAAR